MKLNASARKGGNIFGQVKSLSMTAENHDEEVLLTRIMRAVLRATDGNDGVAFTVDVDTPLSPREVGLPG